MGSTSQRKVDGQFPGNEVGNWFVLHTRSRHEKILADELIAREVPFFLPLIPSVRHYGGRKVTVEVPLFPGYLFLRGSLDQAYIADRTKRVAQIIKVANQEKIHWELQNLFIALSNNAPLDPYPFLKEGVRVEVRSGPLRGLQGVVESRSKFDRILLQVETLGRAVSLEMDGALLDLLE